MPLLPDQVDDYVKLTIDNFTRKSWVDISLPLQEYIFPSKFFKSKVLNEAGGPFLKWQIQVTNTGSFQDGELFGSALTNVTDLVQTAQVEWTKQVVSFAYDQDEDFFQADADTIIRQLEIREHSMYNDYFEGMESRIWTSPTSSTANPRKPKGIPFWLQQSTTAAFGFNGGNPSGFSAGAGSISSTTYPNWSNGTFTYVNITQDDALDKWSEATDKCYFMAPHSFNELDAGNGKWGFYTVHSVIQKLRKLTQTQNDNLGSDVGEYRGTPIFKSHPVTWAPELDTAGRDGQDTNDPIYGINFDTLNWFYKRGRNMVRHAPQQLHPQYSTRNVILDSWGNMCCKNRRRNFVGRKAA